MADLVNILMKILLITLIFILNIKAELSVSDNAEVDQRVLDFLEEHSQIPDKRKMRRGVKLNPVGTVIAKDDVRWAKELVSMKNVTEELGEDVEDLNVEMETLSARMEKLMKVVEKVNLSATLAGLQSGAAQLNQSVTWLEHSITSKPNVSVLTQLKKDFVTFKNKDALEDLITKRNLSRLVEQLEEMSFSQVMEEVKEDLKKVSQVSEAFKSDVTKFTGEMSILQVQQEALQSRTQVLENRLRNGFVDQNDLDEIKNKVDLLAKQVEDHITMHQDNELEDKVQKLENLVSSQGEEIKQLSQEIRNENNSSLPEVDHETVLENTGEVDRQSWLKFLKPSATTEKVVNIFDDFVEQDQDFQDDEGSGQFLINIFHHRMRRGSGNQKKGPSSMLDNIAKTTKVATHIANLWSNLITYARKQSHIQDFLKSQHHGYKPAVSNLTDVEVELPISLKELKQRVEDCCKNKVEDSTEKIAKVEEGTLNKKISDFIQIKYISIGISVLSISVTVAYIGIKCCRRHFKVKRRESTKIRTKERSFYLTNSVPSIRTPQNERLEVGQIEVIEGEEQQVEDQMISCPPIAPSSRGNPQRTIFIRPRVFHPQRSTHMDTYEMIRRSEL